MELLERVQEAVEGIRPYLKDDGGDVKIVEVTDDMEVRVELLGACASCSMSPSTMKAGIEEAIKRAVPEISCINKLLNLIYLEHS